MLAALRDWLGEARLKRLVGLLIFTGLTSLLIQTFFASADWAASAQTALVLIFIAGALGVVSGAMNPTGRKRALFIVLPALGALALAVILPNLLPLFLGVGLGWLIASQMLLRSSLTDRDYKLAVKAMRKQDYAGAVGVMNELIEREPTIAQHYGFRAQLHRLNHDLRRAGHDYQTVLELEPDSSLGANGMAEVCLQTGDLEGARKWGALAYKNAPDDWVAAYNYGLILERLGEYPAAIKHLEAARVARIPESRHRLLTWLWLARCYFEQGALEKAQNAIAEMQAEKKGLKEWRIILESPEAAGLRGLLQQDVRMAEALLVEGQSLTEVFHAE